MAFADKYTTSIFGRRLGLQVMSTTVTGSGRAGSVPDFIVGAEAVRAGVSTAPSTGTNLPAYGVSHVRGTSADSSSVFVLDPPIPGVDAVLYFPSTGNIACYVKTANSEVFHTTLGSSFTTLKSTIGGAVRLTGLTTAIWGVLGITSGTSSNAGGFALTTST